MKTNVFASVAAAVAITLAASKTAAAVPITIFDNQFNTTWDVDNDNNGSFEATVATYTPSIVGAKFRETGQTQVWNVSILVPQPWSIGGVIFAGGGNTTGEMTTEINTLVGYTYTYDWGTNLLGTNPGGIPHIITATAYSGSGTGGSVLNSGTLSNNPDGQTGSFTFAGTGGVVTLANKLTTVGSNGSTDIQVNFVTVTAVPEASSFAMLLFGSVGLWLMRRKRAS